MPVEPARGGSGYVGRPSYRRSLQKAVRATSAQLPRWLERFVRDLRLQSSPVEFFCTDCRAWRLIRDVERARLFWLAHRGHSLEVAWDVNPPPRPKLAKQPGGPVGRFSVKKGRVFRGGLVNPR